MKDKALFCVSKTCQKNVKNMSKKCQKYAHEKN